MRSAGLVLVAMLAACIGEEPEESETVQPASVQWYVGTGGCSTAVVLGLSKQIAEEANCQNPGHFVRIREGAGIVFTGGAVLPYLDRGARDDLEAVAANAPLQINSALRTLAQQYLLYAWYSRGECGITAAAPVGTSNHEGGRAVDIDNWSSRVSAMAARGWAHNIPGDPVHFEHLSSPDRRGADIRAFQILWNRNNPNDKIAVDGLYGPAVESRLKRSPAGGFARGPSCGEPPAEEDGPRIAVGTNDDGRLEVVYVDPGSDALRHVYQTSSGWSGHMSFGPYKAKSVAVASNTDGRLELVYAGTDDVIYHNFQNAPNGGWYGQVHLDGKAKQVAVATNADGRLDVIYIGTNDAIYHNYQTDLNGHWSGEIGLGGKAKQLVAAENPDGSIQIFYVGTNDRIYTNKQKGPNGSFGGEVAFDGKAKQIAVGHHPDGRLEVFYIGTNDALYHNWQTDLAGHWSGEYGLGGKARQLAVGENVDGRIEIFYVGTNDRIYHNFQTAPSGGWNGEMALAGWAKQIAVGRNDDGRLEIFYIGTNNRIYHNWQTAPGAGWHGEGAL